MQEVWKEVKTGCQREEERQNALQWDKSDNKEVWGDCCVELLHLIVYFKSYPGFH